MMTASARRPDAVHARAADANIQFANIPTRRSAIGWPLFRVARYVERYGHGQELTSVPDDREWVRLVPVIGTAK